MWQLAPGALEVHQATILILSYKMKFTQCKKLDFNKIVWLTLVLSAVVCYPHAELPSSLKMLEVVSYHRRKNLYSELS